MVRQFDNEWTEPNLEARIGAIYALERLSQYSERDHIQIMEILCAYIRMNAGRKDVALPEGEPTPEDWRAWAKNGLQYTEPDVEVALKVIEQRDAKRKQHEKDKGYRLGLERSSLRKIVLLQRELTDANLLFAQLQRAFLMDAQLQGAYLGVAELQGARLGHAKLQGANLGGAEFDGNTSLTGASLQGAAVRFTDFISIPQIEPHLQGMFGDASVTLPGGHGPEHESWPAHWPTFELDDEFDEEWEKWQADPEGYVPPDPPEKDEKPD